jgi:hypothetical protein
MKLENTIIDITERFLESHALIAERQGMVAENQLCRERGEEPAYIKGHFDEVAKKLRALKTEVALSAVPSELRSSVSPNASLTGSTCQDAAVPASPNTSQLAMTGPRNCDFVGMCAGPGGKCFDYDCKQFQPAPPQQA